MGQLHSIRYRRDTAANWASVNPVLQEGEPGYETDTGIVKIGDGVTAYNSLGAIFHSEIEALENDINYATTIKQKAITYTGAGEEQIDTQTVNTQVATPASVSVEGVTTTDNVDQSQPSGSSNIGEMVVSTNTQGQTFTPTESKHTKVDIYSLKSGDAGDVTVSIYKWDTDYATTIAGNVLSSSTVLAADVTNDGYTEFNLPCILEVGEVYLYHGTSTAVDETTNFTKFRGNVTTDDYSGGNAYSDGSTTNYDWNFKQHFAKHTESPVIQANGAKLDLTGTKLLTGATIAVNKDGSGKYLWDEQIADGGIAAINCLYSATANNFDTSTAAAMAGNEDNVLVWMYDFGYPAQSIDVLTQIREGTTRSGNIYYSFDNVNYTLLHTGDTAGADGDGDALSFAIAGAGNTEMYLKFDMNYISADWLIHYISVDATLDCTSTQLPLMVPSAEEQTETADLTQNPIDISEGQFWSLSNDLTGWGSRTITMVSSEANFEAQAVSVSTIYVYDSNGTTPWTWSTSNGLVPPADRTSGVVMAKFLVGDNQIKTSVNDGSMKANFNLAWDEESLRAAINRLTDLVNMQYPIVVEVEDVPAIDVENEPTGASAETGYTNDVTSLRQTAAATPAIAYTGLTPREDRFSEWLDVIVECDDGDGTLQGKLYTEGGTLVATYADLMANPVLEISNPDYKYSRERLVLQISASSETTSTAWSVSKITWRYQYNG